MIPYVSFQPSDFSAVVNEVGCYLRRFSYVNWLDFADKFAAS